MERIEISSAANRMLRDWSGWFPGRQDRTSGRRAGTGVPFADKLLQGYFNLVYNPTYDRTVGRFAAYSTLQNRCIDSVEFAEGDRVLCVGVGTGNELGRILGRARGLQITAVDTSANALALAREKALAAGHQVTVLRMDAQRLAFPDDSFDKIVCIHLMDFVPDAEKATSEIMRVLKAEGQFVVTYPCAKEGAELGAQIVSDGVQGNLKAGRFLAACSQLLALLGVGVVFLPLYLRPRRRVYVPEQLSKLFASYRAGALLFSWDLVYVDLIVSGRKKRGSVGGREAGAPGGRILLHPQRGRDLAPVLRIS